MSTSPTPAEQKIAEKEVANFFKRLFEKFLEFILILFNIPVFFIKKFFTLFIFSFNWQNNIKIYFGLLILWRYIFSNFVLWSWIYFSPFVFEIILYTYISFVVLTNFKNK